MLLRPPVFCLHRSVRGSQSGFPLLTPIMETYDGPAWRLISTSFVYSPKHRGALDRLPFQGFARRSGIQVFRLYSRPSPLTESQWRPMMVRVSSSHPYNAGRAGLGCGGGRHKGNVYAACRVCCGFLWRLISTLVVNRPPARRKCFAAPVLPFGTT